MADRSEQFQIGGVIILVTLDVVTGAARVRVVLPQSRVCGLVTYDARGQVLHAYDARSWPGPLERFDLVVGPRGSADLREPAAAAVVERLRAEGRKVRERIGEAFQRTLHPKRGAGRGPGKGTAR